MDGQARVVAGVGLGYRQAIAERTLEAEAQELSWLEIHPENYVGRGGRFRHMLEAAAERYPIVTHGLTLGFGAVEPVPEPYVKELRAFLQRMRVPWHSEHLCFSGTDGVVLHDLLPLPHAAESIRVASARIRELRDRLELPVAVENVSYYAAAGTPEMDEIDFLLEVLEQADAKLLLDVNNVFVNATNHGFDPRAYVDRIPKERVVQLHVAGHYVRQDGLILDTHGESVRDEVFELLDYTLRRLGPVPVLLERDQNFRGFEELLSELRHVHAVYAGATGGAPWR